MLAQRAVTALLLLLFASEAFAELILVRSGYLRFSNAWPSPWPLLIFVVIGSTTALLGRRLSATPILCLFLASMAALLSGVLPSELKGVMGPIEAAWFRFEWSALLLVFGIAFVHFALIFPIESQLIRKNPRFLWSIYTFYALALVSAASPLSVGMIFGMQLLSVLAGLLLGLIALIQKFFATLTSAEKNRLRVALIGCLAGALPAALAAVSWLLIETSQGSALDYGFVMLPLFPLGLVTAVLYENFSEINRWLQRTLIYSLAASGSITCFFLCYWVISLVEDVRGGFPGNIFVISAALALLALFPLMRWSSSYVSTRFYAAEESESAPGDAGSLFIPIEPNPYIVGNPIRSPQLFFGREEDFRFIRTKLQAEEQGCVILLRGERRTGKTSILYQILNGRLGPDFLPVFIDMQGIVVQTDGELLSELAAKIREAALAGSTANVSSLSVAIFTYPDFNHFMDALLGAIGHRRLVLLMDEYELIETKVTSGKLSPEIFGYLDSLLIRHARLSYVFTGSKGLEFTAGWAPILARSVYRDISFLARKDAQALVCTPLQARIRFAPGTVSSLLRLSNGHPFFTQALCQTMVEVLNELKTNLVDGKCVEETVRRLLENAPPQLYYLWTTFATPEKAVLSGLATLLKESGRYLTADRVERLLRSLPGEFPKTLSAPVIRMYFEQLREKTVLDRDQTRYRFTMDLMRQWIQNEHNVWKVLSETGNARAQTR